MKPYHEYQIEQYLRFPEELTELQLQEIEHLLATDPMAKQFALWINNYYRELDLIGRPLSIRVSKIPDTYRNPVTLVLAAMSPPRPTIKLRTTATFGSQEDHTLLRILEKEDDQTMQFHVISRFLHENDRVVIGMEGKGLELVTARGGVLRDIDRSQLEDIRWDSGTIWMKLPVLIWHHDPEKKESITQDISIRFGKDTVSLSVHDNNVTRVLVEQGGQSLFYHVTEDSVQIPLTESEPATFYLYH